MGLLSRLLINHRECSSDNEKSFKLRTPVSPMSPITRRRHRLLGWFWRNTAATLGLGLFAFYLGGVYYLSRQGWIDARLADARLAVEQSTAAEGMFVRSIYLIGEKRTDPAVVKSLLQPTVGRPILAIELELLRRRVEALPWVRAASLERAMPDRLVVRISERQPVALWQQGGRIALVDDSGTLVPDVLLEPFAGLPLFAGQGAPAAAPNFVRLLARTPELTARVTGMTLIRQRRWDVRFDDRVWIKLPADDPEAAWLRFAREQRKHDLLSRNVLAIDLRNPRQWVLRLPPGERLRMTIQNNGT